ncbi:hypothetical protein SELMODRAFT_431960 [Selaginella moellendorffii]|uniref:Uncharacterized protein n=1 Tax=Selaginella moellendorffii TaxID=88036 RepID=D8TEI0_SELML|nr:hypothetical protein SELMODRAFT_431960 [Selaginella moellendorffii]
MAPFVRCTRLLKVTGVLGVGKSMFIWDSTNKNCELCFQLINQKYTGGTRPLGHRVVVFASPDSENIKEDTKEGMVMEAIYGLANEMIGAEKGPFSLFKFTLVKGTASKRVEVDLPKEKLRRISNRFGHCATGAIANVGVVPSEQARMH